MAGQIAMPSEETVPPGAHRALLEALHQLRDLAGRPSARNLSAVLSDRSDLPATMSHSLVSDLFGGRRLASGMCVRALAMALAERTNPPRDAISEANHIERLWRAADDERATRKNTGARSSADRAQSLAADTGANAADRKPASRRTPLADLEARTVADLLETVALCEQCLPALLGVSGPNIVSLRSPLARPMIEALEHAEKTKAPLLADRAVRERLHHLRSQCEAVALSEASPLDLHAPIDAALAYAELVRATLTAHLHREPLPLAPATAAAPKPPTTRGSDAVPSTGAIELEETRRIAEAFLSSSPWLGDAQWDQMVIGRDAGYLADWEGRFDPDLELLYEQQWSWTVTFHDPSGQEQQLHHEKVLEGLRQLVYGEVPAGPESVSRIFIKRWFALPPQERRTTDLSASNSSRICQQALYGRTVFPTEDALNLFSQRE